MSEVKYRADLYSKGERIEGHITVNEHIFVLSRIMPALSRKLFGCLDTFEVPISYLECYQVKSSKIVIGIKGLPEFPRFRCKKHQDLIEEIRMYNPQFRMYASNEITSEFNWRGLIEWGICILAVAGYILLQKMGIL